MNAIDTNVLVYAFDANEPQKRPRAIAIVDALVQRPQDTVLIWQVACEFLSCLRRWQAEGRVTADDVEAYTWEVLAYFPLAFPSANVVLRSLELTKRFSLSHWDSLLVAACLEAGVDRLYTEDLQADSNYDGLQVVNPFA